MIAATMMNTIHNVFNRCICIYVNHYIYRQPTLIYVISHSLKQVHARALWAAIRSRCPHRRPYTTQHPTYAPIQPTRALTARSRTPRQRLTPPPNPLRPAAALATRAVRRARRAALVSTAPPRACRALDRSAEMRCTPRWKTAPRSEPPRSGPGNSPGSEL